MFKHGAETITPPRPLAVGSAVGLAYMLLACFFLAPHWHAGVFVHAGDDFVDAHRLRAPLPVSRHSFGYDGQFYYRLAQAPFDNRPVADGIRFDAPRYRVGRIGYPLLVWLITFGRAGWTASAMLLVNAAALVAIGAIAAAMTRALRLAPATTLAIVLWPGLLETATHDTTELVAAAFLLGALRFRIDQRALPYAICGVAAVMSRETAAAVLFADAARCPKRPLAPLIVAGAVPLAALFCWRAALRLLIRAPAPATVGAAGNNLGVPFRGAAAALARDLRTFPALHGPGLLGRLLPALDRVTLEIGIALFFILVLVRVPAALARGGAISAIVAGFLVDAALMTTLRASGPWIDPTAIGRAFTECWITGFLVLGAAPCRVGPPGVARAIGIAGATVLCIGGIFDAGSPLGRWN